MSFARWQHPGLLGIAATYIVGYGVWTMYATGQRLPAAQPFEASYFALGLPVIVIAIAAVGAIRLLPRWVRGWIQFARWLRSPDDRGCFDGCNTIIVILTAVILGIIVTVTGWTIPGWLWLFPACGLVTGPLMFDKKTEQKTSAKDWWASTVSWALILMPGIAPFYVGEGFERVPQALGGGAPQSVTITICRDALTAELIDLELRQYQLVRAFDDSIILKDPGLKDRPMEVSRRAVCAITGAR